MEIQFKVNEELWNNATKHCACLAIVEDLVKGKSGNIELAQPFPEHRNGTITFVRTQNKVYGITCWHVVEALRDKIKESGKAYSHSFHTMVNGFYHVVDKFVRPYSDNELRFCDIGIRELNPDFLKSIKKEAIDLDNQVDPEDIKFGIAVGFPEHKKYKKHENAFVYKLSMPNFQIVAEINQRPEQRFALFSQLPTNAEETNYSGVSGGPIYWSDSERYGIYGIAYEAGTGGDSMGDDTIFVYGELATPKMIKEWINQL